MCCQTEIDARADRIESVRSFGQRLVKSGHSSAQEIKTAVNSLQDAKNGLAEAWQDRRTQLEQALNLQVSKHLALCILILPSLAFWDV